MDPVRRVGTALLRRLPRLRQAVRSLRDRRRRRTYARLAGRTATRPELVVFEAFSGRAYAGSPMALYRAALTDRRFAEHRFVWSLRRGDTDDHPELADPRTRILAPGSPELAAALAAAGTWVTNAIMAPERRPRPDQRYLQTWHGTPLKRIGLDVVTGSVGAMDSNAEIDRRYREEGRRARWILSSGPFTTTCFTSAFGLDRRDADVPDARLPETGQPRNDALARATPADRDTARSSLGLDPDRRVVLYAPTWRDDQFAPGTGYVQRLGLDVARLAADLGPDWVVLLRLHYLVASAPGLGAVVDGDRVRDVSARDDITELYLAADLLVTDYSSAYFDYALLDRPMVFFMPDLEHYAERVRGFYLPVTEVPGPIVTDQSGLVAALRDPDPDGSYARRRAELNQTYNPHDDGHAATRVLDLLLGD